MLAERKTGGSAKQLSALAVGLFGAALLALGAWNQLSAPATAIADEVVGGITILRASYTAATAKSACEAIGQHLATLDTKASRDAIAAVKNGISHFWTGGYRTSGGVFAWSDGTPFDGGAAAANVIRDEANQDCSSFYSDSNAFESTTCSVVLEGALCSAAAQLEYDYVLVLSAEANGWTAARGYCATTFGTDLAVVYDEARDAEMLATLVSVADGGKDGWDRAWIGYSDVAAEGVWTWVDGVDRSYTNWHEGDPNNAGNEDCGEIAYNPNANWHDWNDMPCDDSFYVMRFYCAVHAGQAPASHTIGYAP